MRVVVLLLGLVSGAQAAETTPRGVFDGILHAARLGVASGKIVLLERAGDPHRVVGAQVGNARVMPVFDVNLHGVAVLARVTF